MHHVIIGAGPAGIIAAETLRKLATDSRITVIGDEPERPYSRMALPYYLVKQIPEQGTHLRKSLNHFSDKRIDLEINTVTHVDTKNHQVALASGKTLNYDKLLVATGSRPSSPPIPGIDSPSIFPCWTLADARNIARLAKPGAKVVLMGAGFIGCIILEALVKSGARLAVIETEDRMVPRMMNEKAGNMIKAWCLEKGVAVYTSTRVTAIQRNDGEQPLTVELDNGNSIGANLVVSATGVKPNIDFLSNSGLKTDHGILINHQMQTSHPDVYAAGDVAQGLDFSTGDYSVQAIQPTSADHGQIAARNMAGLENAYHHGSINMNVLDTIGLISSSFGLWMGASNGDSSELYNPEGYRYINLQFEDDILVGATSIRLTQHIGVLRGLIQSRIKLGKWKDKLAKDPTRIMEAYLANTQALGFNAHLN